MKLHYCTVKVLWYFSVNPACRGRKQNNDFLNEVFYYHGMAQASRHELLSSLLICVSIAISILATMSTAAAIVSQSSSTLAIATRLHLGYASHPPPTSQLKSSLRSFAMMASVAGARYAVVAVDAGPKLEGYDFVKEIRDICNEMNETCENDSADAPAAQRQVSFDVLPVTPWGKFVPALNAIVGWSARKGASYLMLASAEVEITSGAVDVMKSHIMYSDDILVVGEFNYSYQSFILYCWRSRVGLQEGRIKLLLGQLTEERHIYDPWSVHS